MEVPTCSTCEYYRQHYAFDQRKIFRVHYGHCTCQWAKAKRPDTKACENYIQSDPDENAFVSKEYLSKALLEYAMKLELLPEIHEIATKTKKRRS